MKPSSYCKAFLKLENVKNYEFVKQYFGNVSQLVDALHEYRRISRIRSGEMSIWDLLT